MWTFSQPARNRLGSSLIWGFSLTLLVAVIVATDRHAPHAHHGKDLVIIQASHVGYDPKKGRFGVYRRLQADIFRCGRSVVAVKELKDTGDRMMFAPVRY